MTYAVNGVTKSVEIKETTAIEIKTVAVTISVVVFVCDDGTADSDGCGTAYTDSTCTDTKVRAACPVMCGCPSDTTTAAAATTPRTGNGAAKEDGSSSEDNTAAIVGGIVAALLVVGGVAVTVYLLNKPSTNKVVPEARKSQSTVMTVLPADSAADAGRVEAQQPAPVRQMDPSGSTGASNNVPELPTALPNVRSERTSEAARHCWS